MTNTKLPAYFEKYFEQKFLEISDQISVLKLHVNDELADLKEMAKTNQKNIFKLWIIVIVLVAYHILSEEGEAILTLFKAFI